MLGRSALSKQAVAQKPENGQPLTTLLTVVGEHAKMEGKFEIADSIQIECEVGGELNVGGKRGIGEKGVELPGNARVFGDLEAPVVIIEEGVLFEGHCRMTKSKPVEVMTPRDLAVISLKR